MKKIVKYFSVLFLIFLSTNVYASTNTKERTEDDLLVPSKVEVTDENKLNILQTPAVDASEKIYDFADLYTEDEEEKLYEEVKKYIDDYNYDFAIVTIDQNDKGSYTEYADDFYDYNDFKTDGILFLIDMDNRYIYMSTSGDAIKMYSDKRINSATEEVYEYMSDKEYFEGTENFIDIISDYAKSGYPAASGREKMSTSQKLLISFIAAAVITLIVMIILVSKNKLVRKATTAEEYLTKKDVKVTGELLVNTHTTKTKIEHNTSSGSSTHSGSSGISHGGGGHKF